MRNSYRTRAIITRGLYTFYPLFEVHLCNVTFGKESTETYLIWLFKKSAQSIVIK